MICLICSLFSRGPIRNCSKSPPGILVHFRMCLRTARAERLAPGSHGHQTLVFEIRWKKSRWGEECGCSEAYMPHSRFRFDRWCAMPVRSVSRRAAMELNARGGGDPLDTEPLGRGKCGLGVLCMLSRCFGFSVYLCGMCVALALWVGALYSDLLYGLCYGRRNSLRGKVPEQRPG